MLVCSSRSRVDDSAFVETNSYGPLKRGMNFATRLLSPLRYSRRRCAVDRYTLSPISNFGSSFLCTFAAFAWVIFDVRSTVRRRCLSSGRRLLLARLQCRWGSLFVRPGSSQSTVGEAAGVIAQDVNGSVSSPLMRSMTVDIRLNLT
ncbi:hypothetical protein BDR05DRAFT_148964, partial [Suillus weaverae]